MFICVYVGFIVVICEVPLYSGPPCSMGHCTFVAFG
uniref:Uncharacterized protein n=1 Tax=Arundo donax TaxID=35708 RepID=A0A0A9B7U4_ARUDO